MNAKLTIVLLVAVIAAVLVPVSAENVYVDHNPALYEVLPTNAYGYAIFYIRGGGEESVQDVTIWIKNDAVKSNVTFDGYYHPDLTTVDGQNPAFLKVKVLNNGISDTVGPLASGCWTAYLQNGNSNQLETQHFKIGGGATERVTFIGAAHTQHIRMFPVSLDMYFGKHDITPSDIKIFSHQENHPIRKWVCEQPRLNEYQDAIEARRPPVCHWEYVDHWVTIVDYIEVIATINGVHSDINNPNRHNVNLGYSLDLNYFIDNNVDGEHPDMEQVTDTVTGTFTAVPFGTSHYTVKFIPKKEAVILTVGGTPHPMTYPITLTNVHVTSQSWA